MYVFHFIRKTHYRIGIVSVVGLYLIGLLYWFNTNISSTEQFPDIQQPTELAKKYASNVTVGLHISGFTTFSMARNEFQMDGILWFKFPAGTESLATIKNFTFQDSVMLRGGVIMYKSPPIVKLIGEEVLVCFHTQMVIKGRLDYKHFPFGDHKLIFIVQNKNVSSHELCFTSDEDHLTLSDDLLIYDWKAIDKTVITGYIKAPLHEQDDVTVTYPVAAFAVDFSNIGIKDLISLYFPLLVLFFIGLFSLFIDLESESRLTYIAASVPILVLFRMVIDGASPQVGYTTNIDFFYNLLVFLSLILLIFQTYVMLTMRKLKDAAEVIRTRVRNRLEITNDFIFIGTLAALIIFVTYSFFR